jgi:hypothetical protein
MLDTLRKPLFAAAVFFLVVALLVELGSSLLARLGRETPGLGVPYLAFIDGLLVYTIVLMAISLFLPGWLHGKLQGIATVIFSLFFLLMLIFKFVSALVMLFVMVSLFFAPIFGTIAYLAVFGTFPKAAAAMTLSTIMGMKLLFSGCLVFAHQRFLQNKGLVLLVVTSFVGNLLISFLHAFVPGFLVSITDVIAALIIIILAAIWSIFFLIGGIIAVIKAII